MSDDADKDRQPTRRARLLMVVLWPAFVMAGVLEALVFALVDPSELTLPGGSEAAISNMAVYTLAFLLFWVVIAAAAGMAVLLATWPPADALPD